MNGETLCSFKMMHDSIYTIQHQKDSLGISHKSMQFQQRQRCLIVQDPIHSKQTSSEIDSNVTKKVTFRTNFIKMKYRSINERKYIQLLKDVSLKAPFVSVLVFQGSRMSINAFRIIVEAQWKFVTLLNLAKTGITDEAIMVFSKGNWKFMQKLSLSLNPITNKGVTILARCNLANLRVLELEKTKVTFQIIKVISKSAWMQLRVLSFQGCDLGAISLSIISRVAFKNMQCINIKSISTANIFLNCADIAKIATCNPKLKIEVLTVHTKCNSSETIRGVKEMLPNLSSFGMIWGVPFSKGYPQQKIAVELSEEFSDEAIE